MSSRSRRWDCCMIWRQFDLTYRLVSTFGDEFRLGWGSSRKVIRIQLGCDSRATSGGAVGCVSFRCSRRSRSRVRGGFTTSCVLGNQVKPPAMPMPKW